MSAEIRKLKDGELTVYPQTVGTAVILEDGTTVQDLADKVVITDQAEYSNLPVKTDTSVYVVKKTATFGGLVVSSPLIYRNGEYQLTSSWEDGWSYNSYENEYGKTEGSTYFSFIELGKRFDSRGENFDNNSGDIDNANTLNGWRIPTGDEIRCIWGLNRPGATIGDVEGIHFIILHDAGSPSHSDQSPIGVLVFPDNITILNNSNIENIESYADGECDGDYTREDINSFIEQGCIYMPCEGWFSDDSWTKQNEYVELISADEADSVNAKEIYMGVSDFSVGGGTGSMNKLTTYYITYLVKSATADPGVYVGDKEVTSGTGSSGGANITSLLKSAPIAEKRYYNDLSASIINICHPLVDYPGAEVVLLRYKKKNSKKMHKSSEIIRNYKKGWCIATKVDGSNFQYLTLQDGMNTNTLLSFIGSLDKKGKHFGIALRIPNPEWKWSQTKQKNGKRQGIPESLWSDIFKINVQVQQGSIYIDFRQ